MYFDQVRIKVFYHGVMVILCEKLSELVVPVTVASFLLQSFLARKFQMTAKLVIMCMKYAGTHILQ